jgi:hypothetical protein
LEGLIGLIEYLSEQGLDVYMEDELWRWEWRYDDLRSDDGSKHLSIVLMEALHSKMRYESK